MSATDTPRAFPSVAIEDAFGGMALVDYFATHAPEPPPNWWGCGGTRSCSGYAMWNYQYAAAMMAERAKLPLMVDAEFDGVQP